MNATKDEIEQAIWYLIRQYQLDGNDVQGKIALARYINKREIETVASDIFKKNFKTNFDPSKILKGSYIEVRPKSIDVEISGGSNAANTPPILSQFTDYLYYFRLSVEAQICEILWIMKYGSHIDDSISKNAYANRLSLDGEYLFCHYWSQYRKWRDQGFSHELLTSTKANKSIISFDITKFYNSIEVRNLKKEKSNKFPKHIWHEYDKQILKLNSSLVGTLPIGPLTSGIYSNQILSGFDSFVETDRSVLYYGRYVDDILIVCTREDDMNSPLERFARNENGNLIIESNNNRFSFNMRKTKIYDYDLGHPINAFAVFKRLIEDSSSEWKLAPDQEISEIQFSKAISSISSEHSVNKPRSFAEIKIDFKELKHRLSKYLIEFSAVDEISKSESEEIVRALSFAFSGGNAVKYFELWPTLFSVLRFLPNENAIIKIAENIIRNLKIDGREPSQVECIKYLAKHILASYTYASANYGVGVDRDVFKALKDLATLKGSININERSVKQLLWLSLERKLLFNKAKTFEECVEAYEMKVVNSDHIGINDDYSDKMECESIPMTEIEIGKYSKVRASLAHVKVFHNSIELSIKGTRKVTIADFQKIIRPINDAVLSRAHILCFPEVSIPERLLSLVITYSKLKRITIVCGVEHCRYKNYVGNFLVYIQPFKGSAKIYARPKIHYAPSEIDLLKKNKVERVWKSKSFPIFVYKNSALALFNCFELADIVLRGIIKGKVDAVIGLEYNYDIKYFNNIMESLCRDNHTFCLQSNAGQIGENRIIAPIDGHHADLVRFKAGLDPMAITSVLDIYRLRKFHSDQTTKYDEKSNIKFRKLPPGFKKEN